MRQNGAGAQKQNVANTKFGLRAAYVLTVGTVIGSGIFFKAPLLLANCGGSGLYGLIAWSVGGTIMLVCALAMSEALTVCGEEEAASVPLLTARLLGSGWGRCADAFLCRLYYPSLSAVLGWVSASYLAELFWPTAPGGLILLFAAVLILIAFLANQALPATMDRMRTVITVIKLLPLLAMAVVGIWRGGGNGTLFTNLAKDGTGFLAALPAAAFAYEGWIVPAALGPSLKNPRRTLPIALTAGALTVAAVYILYYLGLIGTVSTETLIAQGTPAAFRALFGTASATWLTAAVALSCLGTLSGFSLASIRAAGGTAGLVCSFCWLLWYYFSEVRAAPFPGIFAFDNSELPVITLYALYIPLFFATGRRSGRWLLPALGMISAAAMVVAAALSHGTELLPYLLFSGALLFF